MNYFDKLVEDMGLEVGSPVEVLYKPDFMPRAYNCSWVPEMDESVGKTFQVNDISIYSGGIVLSDGYTYPVNCIRRLKVASKLLVINDHKYEIAPDGTIHLGSYKLTKIELEILLNVIHK